MMINITHEETRLLERYRQLRAVSRKLHHEVLDQVPKKVFTECAETLGLMVNGTLVFETEDESSVLMDYCLYDGCSGDHNVITQFLTQNPYPPDSDEMLLLNAMTRACYSLYSIQSIITGLGVNVTDMLRGNSLLVVDEGLSHTAVDGMVMAVRIITLPDFSMTTGAGLPIDADTLEDIMGVLSSTSLNPEDVASSNLNKQEEAVLSSVIIRCALVRGASSRISYVSPPGKHSPPRHVSKNDPCPCGSGREFKKCCGRS